LHSRDYATRPLIKKDFSQVYLPYYKFISDNVEKMNRSYVEKYASPFLK